MRATIIIFFTFKGVVDMFCEGTYGERLRFMPNWGYLPPPVVQHIPTNPFRTPLDDMVDITNDLGIAILKDHAYTRGNFAFSPYGVASVLVVLYEGARGESARQIHWAAGFPPDRDVIRIGFRDLHKRLKSYFSHEGYLSGITLNKQGSAFKPEYKKILEFYGYDVDESDIQNEGEESSGGENGNSPNNSTSPTDRPTSSTINSITENASKETPESTTITSENPVTINTTEGNIKDTTTSAPGETTQFDEGTPTNEKDDKEVVTTEGFSTSLSTDKMTEEFSNNLTTTEKSDFNITTTEGVFDINSPHDDKNTSNAGSEPETTTNILPTVQPPTTEEQQHEVEDVEKTTISQLSNSTETELINAETTTPEATVEEVTQTSSVNLTPETTSFSSNMSTVTPPSNEPQQEDLEKTKTTTVISESNAETETPTEKTTEIEVLTTTSSSLNMTTTSFSVGEESQEEEKPEVGKPTITTTSLLNTESDKTTEESTKMSSRNPETTLNLLISTTTIPSSGTKQPLKEKPEAEQTTTTFLNAETEKTTEENGNISSTNPETTLNLLISTTAIPSSSMKQQEEEEKPEVEKTTMLTTISFLNTEAEKTTEESTKISSTNPETTLSLLLSTTTMPSSSTREPQKEENPEVEKTTVTTTSFLNTESEKTTEENTKISSANPETTLVMSTTTEKPVKNATLVTIPESNTNTEKTTERNTETTTVGENPETTMFSSGMTTKPISATEEPEMEEEPEGISETTVKTSNTAEKYVEENTESPSTSPSVFKPTLTENNKTTDSTSTVSIDLIQSSTSAGKDKNKDGNNTLLLSLDYGEADEEEEDDDGEEQLAPNLEFDIQEKKVKKQNKRNPRSLRGFSEGQSIKETDEVGKPQAFKYLFPIRKRSLKMEDNSKKKGILICKECLLGNEEEREKLGVISGGRKKRISELELNLQLQNGMYEPRNYDPYRISRRPFLVDGLTHVFVPSMTYTNIFPYAYIPAINSKALEFPLDDIRYKLLILYPMERRGLKKLIYDLGSFPLREVVETLRPFRVKVTVPTFMVEGFVTLTSSLKKMGIWDVFDPRKSDLSGMSLDPELYVTNVEQSIKVVIRNYVEYLDMPTRVFGGRTTEYEFQIWHPFLYFVLDSATNVALMAGQMLDPLNSRIY